MAGPLRWGILGTGNIAGQFAQGVAGASRSVVGAVASRRPDTAAAFAAAHGVPVAHNSYQALLDDPAVQAVYISLPNTMHHEWTLRALAAGKHVLCEKPLAVTVHQAREMFDAADRAGRVLVEAFMYRCHPQTPAVLDLIRSGAIGAVRLIRTSFCYHTRKIEGNIRFDPALAGGCLMDVGCYCLDFARLVAGAEPLAMHASAHLHPRGIDALTVGSLAFPNGVLATFACGMIAQADNTATICGEEGYIEVPVPWKPPVHAATFTLAQGTPPRMDGGKPAGPPPRRVIEVSAGSPLYALEADAFAAAVLDGRPPAVTREQSLGNMRALEELGRQIGLPWIAP